MTQKQKILSVMARQPNRWFYPYDFLREEMFVGYKAPTRLSELNHDYPELFESKPDGKYIKRRLNMKDIDRWFYSLSSDLQKEISRAGLTKFINVA